MPGKTAVSVHPAGAVSTQVRPVGVMHCGSAQSTSPLQVSSTPLSQISTVEAQPVLVLEATLVAVLVVALVTPPP